MFKEKCVGATGLSVEHSSRIGWTERESSGTPIAGRVQAKGSDSVFKQGRASQYKYIMVVNA